MTAPQLTEVVGVYDADGGLLGELRYVLGKILGRAHCGLCDVTHAALRQKPEWTAMVGRLGVPVALLHRNEMSAEVSEAVAAHRLPLVLARLDDARLVVLVEAEPLDCLGGSVAGFEQAVRDGFVRHGWQLPAAP